MIWQLELVLYSFLIITAITALSLRDLLAAVVILTVYSFTMALLFVEMGAVDVGFTEAVVGAGITGVFLISALFLKERRSLD